ncbi:hypothetical protein FB451DRAFT_1403212 [Mycena latifolia]|nr:hypothetical protein FB451DRAFT_1403212 [Mycena latifolia]
MVRLALSPQTIETLDLLPHYFAATLDLSSLPNLTLLRISLSQHRRSWAMVLEILRTIAPWSRIQRIIVNPKDAYIDKTALETLDSMLSALPAQHTPVLELEMSFSQYAECVTLNGHLVQVFETSEIKTEISTALGLQPNAMRVLDHLGISRDNLKGVEHIGGLLRQRSDLHNKLTRLAVGKAKAHLFTSALDLRLLGAIPKREPMTLASGKVVRTDIVLGADGVNTLRSEVPAAPSGWSCFRTV